MIVGLNLASTRFAGKGANASVKGYAPAQNNLGGMYRDGVGVPQDFVEAYTWFAVAAANGHEQAKDNLAMVKSRLNQDQLAVAQQRAIQLSEQINTKKK